MRQMTDRGYDFLENEEGERLFAYDDKTGRRVMPGDQVLGVLTIGVGHTGPDVYPGQTITQEESRRLFDADTDWAEAIVEQTMVGPKGERPNNNQFDAAVSLAFNIGQAGFAGSSVVRNWKAGRFKEAGDSFKLWNQDKFGVNAVLVGRRARETALFFEPMPSELPKPMPQAVEPPKGAAASKSVWTNVGVATGGVALAASNIQPAIDAVNSAVMTAKSAQTTWASLKDLLGSFANGHVYTVVITAAITVGAVYLIRRVVKRVRSGEISA